MDLLYFWAISFRADTAVCCTLLCWVSIRCKDLVLFWVALGIAVIAGSLLGFFLSGQIWGVTVYSADGASVRVAWSSLLALDPLTIGYWRLLVEPLLRDFLTVVAALGLAQMTN